MAIVNAGQLAVYEEIEPALRELVEDVLLNRRPDATERLVDFAEKVKVEGKSLSPRMKRGAVPRSRSDSRTRSSKASSITSRSTPRRRAKNPRARST